MALKGLNDIQLNEIGVTYRRMPVKKTEKNTAVNPFICEWFVKCSIGKNHVFIYISVNLSHSKYKTVNWR